MRAALIVTLLSIGPVAGEQTRLEETYPEWQVLYGQADYAQADRMVADYLAKAREAAAAKFGPGLDKLASRGETEAFQGRVRDAIHAVLGKWPERTPLRARVTGTLERDGYKVEKVLFESRPRYYVTANAYVPQNGKPPFPALLAPVGHWNAGKAAEDYQRLGAYLAQRGVLVLVIDVPGQGERVQTYDEVLRRPLVDPGSSEYFVTTEHGYLGIHAILSAGNLATYLTWDCVRAVDYLVERRDVDPGRIACSGASGGGWLTELVAAVEPRIKVAIPVVYGGCTADQLYRPGIGQAETDALIAPRPLLLIAATGDGKRNVVGKQRSFHKVAKVYELMGAADRIRFHVADSRHGYTDPRYPVACEWLARWFGLSGASCGSPSPSRVGSLEDLAVTVTGQVKTALGGESVRTLARADAAAGAKRPVPSSPEAVKGWGDTLRARIAARLELNREPAPLEPRVLGRKEEGAFAVEKVVYYSDPEVYVPALLFLPRNKSPNPAVVFVHEDGKTAGFAVENYLRPLAEAGHVVLAIDPRGIGETSPGTSIRAHRYYFSGPDADLFYQSLNAGKTLPGMQVRDILKGVDYLETRQEVDRKRITAFGAGLGGLLVEFAAALDGRIGSVVSTGALVSYSSVAERDIFTQRLAAFVPNVLREFDLPEVAASIAPRPLALLNLVDAGGRRMEADQATAAYAMTRQVFRVQGSESRFRVGHADSPEEILTAVKSGLSATPSR